MSELAGSTFVYEKRVSYGIIEGLLIFSKLTSHNLHLKYMSYFVFLFIFWIAWN